MISTYLNTETLQDPISPTSFRFGISFPSFPKSKMRDLLGFPPPPKKRKESQTSLFTPFLFGRTIFHSLFSILKFLNESDIPPCSSPNHLPSPSICLPKTPHPQRPTIRPPPWKACVDMDSLKQYVDSNVSELKDFIASVAKRLPMPVKFTTENKCLRQKHETGGRRGESSITWLVKKV